MTWGAQVRAVVAKDLRAVWWMHAALVVIIAAAVFRVLQNPTASDAFTGWYDTFVPLLAIMLIAAVVREDPPAARAAFWTTQPLSPSAVALAKVLQPAIIALLILVPTLVLLAQGVIPANARPGTIAFAVLVVPSLSVVLLLATTTSTERWKAVIPIGVAWTSWMLLQFNVSEWPRYTASPVVLLLLVALTIGSVAMVGVRYRSHERTGHGTDLIADVVQPRLRKFASAAGASGTPSATLIQTGALSWAAQVRHVFARNLADTWRTLAFAVLTLTVLTTCAVLGVQKGFGFAMLMDYVGRFALLFHIASVVQSDPPPNPTSFWATQPRIPSAVAAAKLLHAGLLMALFLTATLIVQSAWHMDGANRWLHLARTMQVAALLALTVPVAVAEMSVVVPTVAPGPLKGPAFVGAWLGTVYLGFAEQDGGLFAPIVRFVDRLPSWAWLLVAGALGAQLVRNYTHAGRLRRIGGFLVFLPFLLLPAGAPRVVSPRIVPPADLQLALSATVNGDYVWYELVAPRGLPGDTYRLTDWTLTVVHKDGSTTRMSGLKDEVMQRTDRRHGALRLRGDSLHVIGGPFMEMQDSAMFSDLAREYMSLRSARLDDLVSARLEGTIELYESREVDRVPLRTGLALLHDGRRAAMTITQQGTAAPTISLRTQWLLGTPDRRAAWPVPFGMESSDLSFALVNTASGRMLPLTDTPGEYVSIPMWNLGFGVDASNIVLTPTTWTLPKPPVDSAWLAGAELVVGSPVLIGTTRISVSGPVTQPEPRRRG